MLHRQHGVLLNHTFPSTHATDEVAEFLGTERAALVIMDPPYGNVLKDSWDRVGSDADAYSEQLLVWATAAAEWLYPGGALCLWGGIGTPAFRPLYRFLAEVESRTDLRIANHITWAKRRAYGVQHNYLFTREECIYLTLGDPKKPRVFTVPYLDKVRGYAGYNRRYPAHSEYKRRTNVWSDVTELLRGKVHIAQKPQRLFEILIETHTAPGEIVIDPFAGSGTTATAAVATGRRYVLIENDPAAYELCVGSTAHDAVT